MVIAAPVPLPPPDVRVPDPPDVPPPPLLMDIFVVLDPVLIRFPTP